MEMDVDVEGRAKALDKRDRAAQGLFDSSLPCTPPLSSEQRSQEQVQSQANQLGLPGQQKAQPFGHRADPLAKWDCREDMVPQVSSRVCHPTRRTGRTDAAVFAGKGDEQLVAAARAADAGEAVFQDAAAQVALELALNEGRQFAAWVPLRRIGQEGGEVFADELMQRRVFGFAPVVTNPAPRTAAIWRCRRRFRREHRAGLFKRCAKRLRLHVPTQRLGDLQRPAVRISDLGCFSDGVGTSGPSGASSPASHAT